MALPEKLLPGALVLQGTASKPSSVPGKQKGRWLNLEGLPD